MLLCHPYSVFPGTPLWGNVMLWNTVYHVGCLHVSYESDGSQAKAESHLQTTSNFAESLCVWLMLVVTATTPSLETRSLLFPFCCGVDPHNKGMCLQEHEDFFLLTPPSQVELIKKSFFSHIKGDSCPLHTELLDWKQENDQHCGFKY